MAHKVTLTVQIDLRLADGEAVEANVVAEAVDEFLDAETFYVGEDDSSEYEVDGLKVVSLTESS